MQNPVHNFVILLLCSQFSQGQTNDIPDNPRTKATSDNVLNYLQDLNKFAFPSSDPRGFVEDYNETPTNRNVEQSPLVAEFQTKPADSVNAFERDLSWNTPGDYVVPLSHDDSLPIEPAEYLNLGKRNLPMLRLGRSLHMLRLGKRGLAMLRLGKRDLVGEDIRGIYGDVDDGYFDHEKRGLKMLRLGKRDFEEEEEKRGLAMLRLGKRQLHMLRLGKRFGPEEVKRSLAMLRLGKRFDNADTEDEDRLLLDMSPEKRSLNMLRLGKREEMDKRSLRMLRLGKRSTN